MKDLLEVIEEGREGFDVLMEGKTIGTLSGDKSSPVFVNNDLELPRIKNYLTTHTKAILTNQIERMKGDKQVWVPDNKAFMETGATEELKNEYNAALQNQIDYLEDVIKKL